MTAEPFRLEVVPIALLEGPDPAPIAGEPDPGGLTLTCANSGAAMDERRRKLICRCGYFLACSDHY